MLSLVGRVNNFFVHPSHRVLVLFQGHDNDEWIFDPIIDEILEDHEASKRTHEEAFSDEEEDVQ